MRNLEILKVKGWSPYEKEEYKLMKNKSTKTVIKCLLSFCLLFETAVLSSCGTPAPTQSSSPDSSSAISGSLGNTSGIVNKLPDGVNPLANKEDLNANSGEKGNLYYINYAKIQLQIVSDTELQYDYLKLISALQGLLNREKPSVFVEFLKEEDTFWYSYLRLKDKLLFGYKRVDIDTKEDLLEQFMMEIKNRGIVVWDPNVPATSNVASTICGVDGYIPVRYNSKEGSLYDLLVVKNKIKVNIDLNGKFTGKGTISGLSRKSSGSSKCDAYLWAMEKYIDKTNIKVMGNMLDGVSWAANKSYYPDLNNTFVTNHDYLIAKKAFVFDLSPWGDEAPCDDLNQPLGTDLATMKEILQRQYNRSSGNEIFTICGFTPWQIKYTAHLNKGKHEEVSSEWQYAEIVSAYNGIMDADAAGYCGLANASIYTLYPLKEKYENSTPKTVIFDKNKKYINIYMGDYDSAAWTVRFVPKMFNDIARGTIPLNWAFNPNLSDRIPMVFDYLYETKTDMDYFIAGDSGAGYLNPSLLVPPRKQSDNPSGIEAWIKHNKYYYTKFDLSITGFVIDGAIQSKPEARDAYKEFSYNGVIANNFGGSGVDYNGVYWKNQDADVANPSTVLKTAVQDISKATKYNKNNFYSFRTILVTPSFVKSVIDECQKQDKNIVFVDSYTFFDLIKQSKNN